MIHHQDEKVQDCREVILTNAMDLGKCADGFVKI